MKFKTIIEHLLSITSDNYYGVVYWCDRKNVRRMKSQINTCIDT